MNPNRVLSQGLVQFPPSSNNINPNEPSKSPNNPQPPKNNPPPKILSTIPQQYINNPLLNRLIDQILPKSYNFQIHKTLYRIDLLWMDKIKQSLKGRDGGSNKQPVSLQIKSQPQPSFRISLQFPQGLLMFSILISQLLTKFTKCPNLQIIIMGDVTYGACCIDDIASTHLNCDLLVHYGHSCLIPINQTRGKVMYVFVEMTVGVKHMVETVHRAVGVMTGKEGDKLTQISQTVSTIPTLLPPPYPIYLMGTIQFNSSLHAARALLMSGQYGYKQVYIPQEKPRSSGQVLGCTSPIIPIVSEGVSTNKTSSPNQALVIFVADGRFHMQSSMIANPTYKFYQYNPYSRQLTEEQYQGQEMVRRRNQQIKRGWNRWDGKVEEQHRGVVNGADQMKMNISGQSINRNDNKSSTNNELPPSNLTQIDNIHHICIIMGTLGRQGSQSLLERIIHRIDKYNNLNNGDTNQNDNRHRIDYMVLMASQITPSLLAQVDTDMFVQLACPRLSIDWGYANNPQSNNKYVKPLLNTFQFFAMLEHKQIVLNKRLNNHNSQNTITYTMDFYSYQGGEWGVLYGKGPKKNHTERDNHKLRHKPTQPLLIGE